MVKVIEVEPGTETLAKVQGLWRRHSNTLGFFPVGAFEQHARDRCILAALGDTGELLGYTLFRSTNRRKVVSIVHLCVDPAAHRQGVARQLFDALKLLARNCDDILVRCRRDFEASALWPRLGFIPVSEAQGRGKDAQVVTTWRHEVNRLPLLAVMDRERNDLMPVAIDANIFFDLDEKAGTASHEESKALTADWLGAFVELCLTEEIYNEINRREDPAHRARQRLRVDNFKLLPFDKARAGNILTELGQLFPTWKSESAQSDMRQIMRAIAGGVTHFVTRDGLVRDQAEDLYDRYGLVVVSPFELVLHFDELRRDEEYRPKRFLAAGLHAIKPRDMADVEKIADLIYVGQPAPGPRKRTLAQLRDMLAATDRFDLTCITDSGKNMIAAYAVERPATEILRIPLFAVANSALGRTTARHFTEKLVTLAAAERRTVVMIEEDAGGRRVEEALLESGFSKEGTQWLKFAPAVVAPPQDLATKLAELGARHAAANSLANRMMAHLGAEGGSYAEVERALWPAKIIGTGLACYIVPIRPHWAEHLFDLGLAKQTLFGPDPKLIMNSENAYYRASNPAILSAPARVLWYVSQDTTYQGTMAIRACSYLDDILVASPKEAFRRFQRLGVYQWRDVFKVANNDLEQDVMAFQFSKTEMLRRPIARGKTMQEVLRRHGGKGTQFFLSPVKITEACFLELYQLGMNEA